MFEFKIILDDNDYLLFNQYHLLNSPNGKKSLLFNRFLIPIISIMTVVILCMTRTAFLLILIEAIMLTIFSIFWIVYNKKFMFHSMKKHIKKIKKKVGFLIARKKY